jgi:hypothetical protein
VAFGQGFLKVLTSSPANIIPLLLSISYIIWRMNNSPVGDWSTETHSHPINMNKNNNKINTNFKLEGSWKAAVWLALKVQSGHKPRETGKNAARHRRPTPRIWSEYSVNSLQLWKLAKQAFRQRHAWWLFVILFLGPFTDATITAWVVWWLNDNDYYMVIKSEAVVAC